MPKLLPALFIFALTATTLPAFAQDSKDRRAPDPFAPAPECPGQTAQVTDAPRLASWICTVDWFCEDPGIGTTKKSGTASGSGNNRSAACLRAETAAKNVSCPPESRLGTHSCKCVKDEPATVEAPALTRD